MKVNVEIRKIMIPTYEVGEAEKLPIFCDHRVYQGSSGKVYPHAMTEHVSDKKTPHEYEAIFLENVYLLVMILPELGGRIQRILDKTNGYDAIYYNEVIKPALVGLSGPWISGGIEFNWPQHHRPSTFDPVSYEVRENADGSCTVWVGEIEKMFHTKGMAGYTLYPDKAFLEIKGQLYNPTESTQTFLWWANPAVSVNDQTSSIFPPDVHAVVDHGKRDVSSFPIATGTYYKVDYSKGVDISKYSNIPVPTSYMAYHSDYDFLGNYDYGKAAGILHIADHHIAPGKKQWTWGCGDFGKAWDRHLTDENGPYIELMAGVFTDNQPDFTFLAPYEEKTFTQYFMPYKTVGNVKNANTHAVLGLEVDHGKAQVKVYSPSMQELQIILEGRDRILLNERKQLSPILSYAKEVELMGESYENLRLLVKNTFGELLCQYQITPSKLEELPKPAEAAKKPNEITSLEELYLTAVHLEQYRHATYSAEDYYLEGLRRDATDSRINNGYGKYLYGKGYFKESQHYFEEAIKKITWKNSNPYDTEPFYNLGLALERQGEDETAFDAFYKAIWSDSMARGGFYKLACLASKKGKYEEALAFVEQALIKGMHHMKARHLKTALLRKLKREKDAAIFAQESIHIDALNDGASYERYLLMQGDQQLKRFEDLMRSDVQNYIELASNYIEFGMLEEAIRVLGLCPNEATPMVVYYKAYCLKNQPKESVSILERAKLCDSKYCFPNSLEDLLVLEYALSIKPDDELALYLIGNLLYDKGRSEEAIFYWERAKALRSSNPIIYRNLAHAYYNKCHEVEKAYEAMQTAYQLAPQEARLFYELDCLIKIMNTPTQQRLENYENHLKLVSSRDDLYIEYITLLNIEGQYEKALDCLLHHHFKPWEGGEGKVSAQYKFARQEIAQMLCSMGKEEEAKSHLEAALVYPESLGEGKLIGNLDNDIYYALGCLYEGKEPEKANQYFGLASRGDETLSAAVFYNDEPPEMMYYRALAKKKLGHRIAAENMFEKLVTYGTSHMKDHVEIDYFAVSLPDFLVFEADLDKKNRVNCCYLLALGKMGLGCEKEALKWIEEGLSLECSHQGLRKLMKEVKVYEEN